jgi:hypothetical protein
MELEPFLLDLLHFQRYKAEGWDRESLGRFCWEETRGQRESRISAIPR